MSARPYTPYCPKCNLWFRYGPHPAKCPTCYGPIEVRDMQFEQTCQAMPQNSSATRRRGQAIRYARERSA